MLANGTIDLDVTIDIDKPRLRTDPRFLALKERLLDQLGVGARAGTPALVS